jgi:hypothetical protein
MVSPTANARHKTGSLNFPLGVRPGSESTGTLRTMFEGVRSILNRTMLAAYYTRNPKSLQEIMIVTLGHNGNFAD